MSLGHGDRLLMQANIEVFPRWKKKIKSVIMMFLMFRADSHLHTCKILVHTNSIWYTTCKWSTGCFSFINLSFKEIYTRSHTHIAMSGDGMGEEAKNHNKDEQDKLHGFSVVEQTWLRYLRIVSIDRQQNVAHRNWWSPPYIPSSWWRKACSNWWV